MSGGKRKKGREERRRWLGPSSLAWEGRGRGPSLLVVFCPQW